MLNSPIFKCPLILEGPDKIVVTIQEGPGARFSWYLTLDNILFSSFLCDGVMEGREC